MQDLNHLVFPNLKAKAKNNFLENIKSSPLFKEDIPQNNDEVFVNFYNDALGLFKACISQKKPEKKELEKAGEKFIEALSFKSTNSEPYMCLAYIYYILDSDESTLKYIEIADLLDRDKQNKPFLDNLKELVTDKKIPVGKR